MENGPGKIELRSDDVREILERPPHSLVRYGTSAVCFILFILFIGSFIFRYPDIISGQVVITTETPPVWIVAKSTGRVKELNRSDKQYVKSGDLIGVIENPAITEDVLYLKKMLIENVRISDSAVYIPPTLFRSKYELGELQPAYSAFDKMVNKYQNFLSLNLITQDRNLIYKQIEGRDNYVAALTKQLELRKKELQIAESSYNREKSLFERGVISRSEFEATEQEFLTKQQNLQQLEAAIVSENIENAKLRDSAGRLGVEYLQDKNNIYADLLASYRELLAEIEKWEQTYLLICPQSGYISFDRFWSKNQEIKSGDKVFAVIPEQPGEIIGKMQVPADGSGKIAIGQKVNIKVAGYPYLEYGMLTGEVRNISLVANEYFYTVEVDLKTGLLSTMNRQFDFNGELEGVAEIITEDRSLAVRILSPLKYLLNNHL
ncbi:MAG TPA: HlyD family secretion protein [Dysgonomonas sp.]|nr:HlyD family secretion protein [Dysgonomonas sp.]